MGSTLTRATLVMRRLTILPEAHVSRSRASPASQLCRLPGAVCRHRWDLLCRRQPAVGQRRNATAPEQSGHRCQGTPTFVSGKQFRSWATARRAAGCDWGDRERGSPRERGSDRARGTARRTRYAWQRRSPRTARRRGTNGKAVLNGSGPPDDGLGADGDFYLDTSADAIYGPKSSGTWGNATSLIGASGPSGTANVVTKTGIVIVPANGQSTVYADCPASSTVTGGGFAAAGPGLTVTESTPTDHNGTQSWVVEATNTSTTTAIELVAEAQCAS